MIKRGSNEKGSRANEEEPRRSHTARLRRTVSDALAPYQRSGFVARSKIEAGAAPTLRAANKKPRSQDTPFH